MNPLLNSGLARGWLEAGSTHGQVFRWSWFDAALRSFALETLNSGGLSGDVDEARSGRAFFEWASRLELVEPYARYNAIDHAHFICGQLLACLLRWQPIRLAQLSRTSQDAEQGQCAIASPAWPQGEVLVGFVSTLLHALRLNLNAGPAPWQDDVCQRHWQSFRENVTEDPDLAVPFFDLFHGLEPAWEFPLITGKRPAALRSPA